jgi:hypothetical protein
MYCPKCRAEYREGFDRCSDCNTELVEVLPPPAANSSQSIEEEEERPDLARTRYFLAWFFPMSLYLGFLFVAWLRPFVFWKPLALVFFLCLQMIAIAGALWMLFQALRYERRALKYALLAAVPFMFVWYALVRVPLLREFRDRSPSIVLEDSANAESDGPGDSFADGDSAGAMFCPLCKSEFRPGFTQCSDCHIPLTPSRSQAMRTPVARIWKGGDKRELERALTALRQGNVPLVFRQHMSTASALGQGFLSFFLLGATQGLSNEFEVRVLASDARRAQLAMQQALAEPEQDD